MNICGQCGGAIMVPGLAYGYAGQVCMCSWRAPVAPMPQAQIDEALVLAIEADKAEIERLRAELAASQAREKSMLGHLRTTSYHPVKDFLFEVLERGVDTSALDAMLAQRERETIERCAKVCDARYMGDNNREDMEARRCAAAIRALGVKP